MRQVIKRLLPAPVWHSIRRRIGFRSWQDRQFAAPSPGFVKELVFLRNNAPDTTWVATGTYRRDTTYFHIFFPSTPSESTLCQPEPIRGFKRPDLALGLAAPLPQIRLNMIGGTQRAFEETFDQISIWAAGAPIGTFHGRSRTTVSMSITKARACLSTHPIRKDSRVPICKPGCVVRRSSHSSIPTGSSRAKA
jgi:hypothetical protein